MDAENFDRALLRVVSIQMASTGLDPVSAEDVITSAYSASMSRRRLRHGKLAVYWWLPEIAENEENVRSSDVKCSVPIAKKRKKLVRSSISPQEYFLRSLINESKARCWPELIEDVNRDPWGLGYKARLVRYERLT